MIVSFQYRFAFLKTRKTAGTSIEVDLSRYVEPGAVVTPVTPPEPGHIPRNFEAPSGKAKFFNHMTAYRLREALGAERFAGLRVFCMEREPVSKCLSHFHMLKNRAGQLSESERGALKWADYVERGDFPVDHHLYSDPESGARMVENILEYERLPETVSDLLDSYGIKGFCLIARAKSGFRRPEHMRVEDVTPAQRARIYQAFLPSIAVSGLYQSQAREALGGALHMDRSYRAGALSAAVKPAQGET